MRSNAYLINTSQGGIVDEEALYDCLHEKIIAGAALDVYSQEPTNADQFPFIDLDNVIALPHLGGSTEEAHANVSRMICENMIEALENQIYVNSLNLPFLIDSDQVALYRPYLHLVKKLGQFLGQWNHQPITKIRFTYRLPKIHDLRPLFMTACVEILKYQYPEVNLIEIQDFLEFNEIDLLIQSTTEPNLENTIKLEAKFENGESFDLRGTVIANIPKIVELITMPIELIPRKIILVVESLNVPGVVGPIATLLGEKTINILDIHIAQSETGKKVISCLILEYLLDDTIITEILNIPNILSVRLLDFTK
jgi:D-3-phosphoglycerate dehydrogenase